MGIGAGISGAASGATAGAALGPWGAVIGGGVGFVGGLLGSRKSPLQKAAEGMGPGVLKSLEATSKDNTEKANQFGKIALPAVQNAGAYYNDILDPNNTKALNAAIGSQREAITDGAHRGALRQAAEFAPRGGGRVAAQSQSLGEINKQLMQLLAQARGGAAQGLLQVGGTAGNLSQAFANLSANERQALMAAISDIIGVGNRQRNQDGAFAAGAFKDIGGLLADIISKGKGGGGSSGGGTFGGITGAGDIWPEN